MASNDGGPAFPHHGTAVHPHTGCLYATEDPGMSLRDHFAGQAMAAIIGLGGGYKYTDPATNVAQEAARDAYVMADAMLAARTTP